MAESMRSRISAMLINNCTYDEVIAELGCKTATVSCVACDLRKKGYVLRKHERKPRRGMGVVNNVTHIQNKQTAQKPGTVRCTESIKKKCIYGGKSGSYMICEYLLITGHMRKCKGEECDCFEHIQKGKKK